MSGGAPHSPQKRCGGLVGEQVAHHPGGADGVLAHVGAHEPVAGGAVARGVDEVDHGGDAAEALGQLVGLRDPERDAGDGDLPAGPAEPAGHRRLGAEQHPGDVRGRQPAQGPQRQGDPGVEVEARVAAGEDQAELVVLHRRRGREVGGEQAGEGGGVAPAAPGTAGDPAGSTVGRSSAAS